MTKAELVENVLQATTTTKAESLAVVETIFGGIAHSLLRGEKVEVRGFGTFGIRQRKPRMARNPRTGASVEVPAKKVAFFKPSKDLRVLVNGAESR